MSGVMFSYMLSLRFAPRSVVLTSVSTWALIYAVLPFEDLAFQHASSGIQMAERLLIVLQLSSIGVVEMGFSKSIPFFRLHPPHSPKLVRCRMHVYFLCSPQQVTAGRGEWPSADGGVDPRHGWTSRSGLAVYIHLDE